jgi:hypothetical protein
MTVESHKYNETGAFLEGRELLKKLKKRGVQDSGFGDKLPFQPRHFDGLTVKGICRRNLLFSKITGENRSLGRGIVLD